MGQFPSYVTNYCACKTLFWDIKSGMDPFSFELGLEPNDVLKPTKSQLFGRKRVTMGSKQAQLRMHVGEKNVFELGALEVKFGKRSSTLLSAEN